MRKTKLPLEFSFRFNPAKDNADSGNEIAFALASLNILPSFLLSLMGSWNISLLYKQCTIN